MKQPPFVTWDLFCRKCDDVFPVEHMAAHRINEKSERARRAHWRAALLSEYESGKTFAEIGRGVGVTAQTAKQHVRRAMHERRRSALQ